MNSELALQEAKQVLHDHEVLLYSMSCHNHYRTYLKCGPPWSRLTLHVQLYLENSRNSFGIFSGSMVSTLTVTGVAGH